MAGLFASRPVTQYLPISSPSTRPDEPEAAGWSHALCDYQPIEWRLAISRAWWYRYSSFSYCVVGALTAARPQPLWACAPFFPFRTMGLCIFANGILSYMGDVATWGYNSRWKTADVAMAVTNTLLQGLIVLMSVVGIADFPALPTAVLAVSLVVAIFCKKKGEEARNRLDCDGYLRWHTAWHLTLPIGAGIASQVLLDMPDEKAASRSGVSEAPWSKWFVPTYL